MKRVRLQFILFIIAFAAVTQLAGCAKKPVETVVEIRDITSYLPLDGEIVVPAIAKAEIHAPYDTAVSEVFVTVGKNVKKGETVLMFAAPEGDAYYQQARRDLQRAEAALAKASADFARQVRYARAQAEADDNNVEITTDDPGVTPETVRRNNDLALMDAELRMQEGLVPYQRAVEDARERFRDAQAGAKTAQAKAPISGIVLEVNAVAGQTPNSDEDSDNREPLVTIVDLSALKVAAGIDEDRLDMITPKSSAMITLPDRPSLEFTGSVNQVYSEKAGFLQGQKYFVMFDFRNTKGEAKPGMDAKVSVKVGETEDVPAVLSTAIRESGEQHIVMLKQGNEWQKRVVQTGITDGKYTQITSGLKEGDIVQANAGTGVL